VQHAAHLVDAKRNAQPDEVRDHGVPSPSSCTAWEMPLAWILRSDGPFVRTLQDHLVAADVLERRAEAARAFLGHDRAEGRCPRRRQQRGAMTCTHRRVRHGIDPHWNILVTMGVATWLENAWRKMNEVRTSRRAPRMHA
jgi:hypothetical protein